jgi:hypothetical protein
MNIFDRFLCTIYDICKYANIHIMLGLVTNYRAYASVMTLFLREYNVSCFINTELYPISEQMLQVIGTPEE